MTYYDIDHLKKLNYKFNILTSGRGQGKSYSAKSYCLSDAYASEDNKLIYLRRYIEEAKDIFTVTNYFKDAPIEKITKKKWSYIAYIKQQLFFAKDETISKKIKVLNEKGEEEEKLIKETKQILGPCAGYVCALSQSMKKKSQVYTDVQNIIFEEFITMDTYLKNEPDMLLDFCSTVFRNDVGQVWLLGNEITRFNPYARAWCLNRWSKQKTNTIDVYHHEYNTTDGGIDTIDIAIEKIPDLVNAGGMAFGTHRSAIVKGNYYSRPMPILDGWLEKYNCMYKVIFTYDDASYIANLLNDEIGNVFWYIYPAKDGKEYKDIQRHISNNYENNNFHTLKIQPINEAEILPFKLFKLKKICYSDNLTGTEFEDIILRNLS